MSFGREWPLETPLELALSRASLDVQLSRARERMEQEQGLRFGAVRLERDSLEQCESSRRFVFNGGSYTAERFTVDGTSAQQAERLVPGQRVTAYVPPEHPERAVLDPGLPFVKVIIGGALALTFLVLSVLYGLTTLAKILGLDSWPFTFNARARGRS